MLSDKETTPEKVAFNDEQIRLKAYLLSQKYPERSSDDNWAAAIQALEKERPFRHWIAFWQWTGIGEKKGWDILQLLISASIPILILFGTQYFTSQNNKQQREIAKKNNEKEQEIAQDKDNQATLVKYFEEMATLLDNGLLKVTEISDEKFIIAQAKTVIALQSLDPKRQHLIIQFLDAANLNNLAGGDKGLLYEARMSKANLIKAELIGSKLRSADLSGAELFRANLSGANLSGTNLLFTDLSSTNLSHANFSSANLPYADLSSANLSSTNLSSADLSSADLSSANLSSTNLSSAILLNTDLRETKNLTQSQLENKEPPLICNSPLPQAIKIDRKRDCDKVADALQKRYPKEFTSLDRAEKYVQNLRQEKWD